MVPPIAGLGPANEAVAEQRQWMTPDRLARMRGVLLGLTLFFRPHALLDPIHLGSAPKWSDLVFALTVTTIAFTSVESASGLAGEVKISRGALRRLVASGTALVMVGYVGIALVAVTALPVHGGHTALGDHFMNAPVIGIVTQVRPHWLAQVLNEELSESEHETMRAAAPILRRIADS